MCVIIVFIKGISSSVIVDSMIQLIEIYYKLLMNQAVWAKNDIIFFLCYRMQLMSIWQIS